MTEPEPSIIKANGLAQAFELWAKTDRSTSKWHALPYHLVDVGAAAEALWARLPTASRKVAIDAFGDEDLALRCVVFLAAAHDVGKANRFFQKKDPRQADRLAVLGFDLAKLDEPARHGQATGAYLKPWIVDRYHWSEFVADSVALAVGGHHGTFFFPNTGKLTLQVDLQP